MLKRNWKTVELEDADMADFAAMGGLEIDVLSDDSNILNSYRAKGSPDANVELKTKAKKKKTKSKAKPVVVETPSHSSPEVVDVSLWEEFGLDSRIVDGLRNLGFTTPTPIQTAVIAKALTGRVDVLGAAQTGSGKTLAFGLPILHSILSQKSVSDLPTIKALCILPTRELAVQVKDHLSAIIAHGIVYIGTVIGGMSVDKQVRVLSHKPDIVVGTPGRIAGLLGLSSKKDEGTAVCPQFKTDLCTNLTHLVLDEADRLLEQAHFRDLTSILSFLYESVDSSAIQSYIFSATLPVEGHDFARLLSKLQLKPPAARLVADMTSAAAKNTPSTLSFRTMFPHADSDREAFLIYYLHNLFHKKTHCRVIVFVNAISYVYRLGSVLPLCFEEDTQFLGIHSSLKQKDRLKKLDQFKAAKRGVLIATDLAARGLDLPKVDAVVHLQPPRTPESLIHRSGRTARAGQTGECILLITPEQIAPWKKAIRMGLNLDIEQIKKMDVVSGDIRNIREIQRLASLIEGQSHKDKRASKDRAWSKKACAETDLWDSDEEEEENDEEEYQVGRHNDKKVKPQDYEQLADLILTPLPSKIER